METQQRIGEILEDEITNGARKVVILFQSPLFGDVVRRLLLDSQDRLDVVAGRDWPLGGEEALSKMPSVLIVERAWAEWRRKEYEELPLVALFSHDFIDKVIVASLKDTTVTVYAKKSMSNVTGYRLLKEILS